MDAVFGLARAAAEVVGEGLPGTLCEKQTISDMGKRLSPYICVTALPFWSAVHFTWVETSSRECIGMGT